MGYLLKNPQMNDETIKLPDPRNHDIPIYKIDKYGSKFWYVNNKLHNDNDLPAGERHKI